MKREREMIFFNFGQSGNVKMKVAALVYFLFEIS